MPGLAEVQKKLEGVFAPPQAVALAEVITEAYSELVKTSDFNELKEIVRNLGMKMGELAEAQKRTEQRMEELAEAQKRTEQRMEELAGVQKKSEERLTQVEKAIVELAGAQKRTEQRMEELAGAQKRTEEEISKLTGEHRKTREWLGGLSITVGYRLEDEAFKALPELIERDFGFAVQGRLRRQFIKDNKGKDIEVNIIGDALRNDEKVTIVGESKSQLSKNNVDEFIRRKLNRLGGVLPKIFPVLVTYMISEPDVEAYAKEKGIALYYSYDF